MIDYDSTPAVIPDKHAHHSVFQHKSVVQLVLPAYPALAAG